MLILYGWKSLDDGVENLWSGSSLDTTAKAAIESALANGYVYVWYFNTSTNVITRLVG